MVKLKPIRPKTFMSLFPHLLPANVQKKLHQDKTALKKFLNLSKVFLFINNYVRKREN